MCPKCGSDNLTLNIRVSQSVETGHTGLSYRSVMFLSGSEAILADLCQGCGTIVRFHVSNTDRKWHCTD